MAMHANTFNGGLVLEAGNQRVMSDLGTYTTEIQGLPAGMAWFMDYDGADGIYYSDQCDDNRIYRWNLDSRFREPVFDGPACGLKLAGGAWLYFIDERTRHLCRLRTDRRSGGAETVVDQPVICYTVHEDRIYYSTPARMETCGLDGTHPSALMTASASSIVVAGGRLVYADRGRGHVLTIAGLDGGGREELQGAQTLLLNTDGKYVYFCNHLNDCTVYRMDPATGSVIRIFGDPAAWLHVIEGQMYFWHDRHWHVISLAGGQAQKVSR